MSAPIEAKGLAKRYGSFTAVEDVSLTIEAGEVYGLLGPNGSGKTTMILMILGLTEASHGDIRVLGLNPLRDPLEVKRRVGYLPDSVGFYGTMTARQNLRYTGRLAGLSGKDLDGRIEAALSRVRLTDVGDSRVNTFSHGMRQRLGLAEVLVKRPSIIILDEPTTGMDPQATQEFLELIGELKAEGNTVLLSSHLLGQVQAVCDRVGLFHRGRVVLEGTVQGIADRIFGGHYRIDVTARGAAAGEALAGIPGVAQVAELGDHRFRLKAKSDIRRDLVQQLSDQKVDLLEMSLVEVSLDEVYNSYFREVAHAA